MYRTIRRHLEARRAIRRDAELLIEEYGAQGFWVAREQAWLIQDEDQERFYHWLRVASAIDRRFGIDRHADTATRYLTAP